MLALYLVLPLALLLASANLVSAQQVTSAASARLDAREGSPPKDSEKETTREQEKQPGEGKLKTTPQPRKWNRVQGGWGHITFSTGLFTDYFQYSQDDASRNQVGDLGEFERFEVRAFRLGAFGKINSKLPVTWIFFAAYRGFDRGFDRSRDDAWLLYDLALNITLPRVGTLSVGKMKEPFSLERTMAAPSLAFLERPAALDALLQTRNNGIKLSNTALGQRITWSGGWFPGFVESDKLLSSAEQVIGRVTGVPVNGRDGGSLLHLGFSTRYSYVRGDLPAVVRYRGTPESFNTPKFVDTV